MDYFTLQNATLALLGIVTLALILSAIVLYRHVTLANVKTDIANVETEVATVSRSLFSKITDRMRMVIWLAFGLAAYAASLFVGPSNPVIQTTLYKIGHVTTLAWIGYWISRHSVGRITTTATQGDKLSRALVVGAVIIAGSLGL